MKDNSSPCFPAHVLCSFINMMVLHYDDELKSMLGDELDNLKSIISRIHEQIGTTNNDLSNTNDNVVPVAGFQTQETEPPRGCSVTVPESKLNDDCEIAMQQDNRESDVSKSNFSTTSTRNNADAIDDFSDKWIEDEYNPLQNEQMDSLSPLRSSKVRVYLAWGLILFYIAYLRCIHMFALLLC